jgi:cytochrome c2
MLFSINASALQDAPTILQTKACGSCHVIPGVKDAYGKAGPSLKGLSERSRIAGNLLENNTENMRMWLTNPKSINPATLMPNMGLTEDEVQIVIEYLNTL